jgi:hypothetical protein
MNMCFAILLFFIYKQNFRSNTNLTVDAIMILLVRDPISNIWSLNPNGEAPVSSIEKLVITNGRRQDDFFNIPGVGR